MKISLKLIFIIISYFIISCGSNKNDTLDYFKYESECLGSELDGTVTLRAWGKGKNKNDAVEQAEKNALNDVLFKGIRRGKSECELTPMITEVNARDKYEQYFDKFFNKDRKYSKYISYKDGSFKKEFKSKTEVVYGVTVRVLSPNLKKKLKKDKILK